MLAVKQRKVKTIRHEYAVESPATQRDISDAIFLARTRLDELQGKGASDFDNAIMVRAYDDEVVVYFDTEEDA